MALAPGFASLCLRLALFAMPVCFAAHAAPDLNATFVTSSLSAWTIRASELGQASEVSSGYRESGVTLGSGYVHYGSAAVLAVGRDWETWCCGYHGQVAYSGRGSSRRFMIVNGVSAIGFFVEPQSLAAEHFTVTLSDGKSISFVASGSGEPRFFGFVGRGIRFLTLVDDSGGSFAFGDFRFVKTRYPTQPAEVIANYGYLTSNQFSTTIAVYGCMVGSQPCLGSLDELLYDTEDDYGYSELANSGANFTGGNTYIVPLTRNLISSFSSTVPARYDTFASDWLVEPPYPVVPYDIPQPWIVYDVVRNSVYNTPAESECDGSSSSAYIVSVTQCSNVQYTTGSLNTQFQSQVVLNGTGISNSYGVIKSRAATFLVGCHVSGLPSTQSVFLIVPAITGACNTTISTSSVATYPLTGKTMPVDPLKDSDCGDNVVAVTSSDTNMYTKIVADECPACGKVNQNMGAHFHIDNWSDSMACSAHSFSDLPQSLVANTRGSTQ